MGLRRSDSKHHQECCAEMSHDRSLDSAIRSPSAFPPKNPKQYCKSVVNQPPTWAESLSPTEKRLGASGGNVERARYTALASPWRESAGPDAGKGNPNPTAGELGCAVCPQTDQLPDSRPTHE